MHSATTPTLSHAYCSGERLPTFTSLLPRLNPVTITSLFQALFKIRTLFH